jgi:site-specific recombinase XerD
MTIRYNAENERLKHKYFWVEKEGRGKSEKTIDNIRKALNRFEAFTNYQSYKGFSNKVAADYKAHLFKASNAKGKPLSLSTIEHALSHLREFLMWLSDKQGYKRAIHLSDLDFLKLNSRDRAKQQAKKLKEYASSEQMHKVIMAMPHDTDVQKRNRALIAFIYCTGIRDGALLGLRLKHINPDKRYIVQDPKEVETKFGKHINTKFFPVGEDIHQIAIEWVRYLREEMLFSDNDPLFPKEQLTLNEQQLFEGGTLSRQHWKSASPVRGIFKQAFAHAGVQYYPPHRVRDTLSALGRKFCLSLDEQMAWARNMGHESPQTTFVVYGGFSPERQFEVMDKIHSKAAARPENQEEILRALQLIGNAVNSGMTP